MSKERCPYGQETASNCTPSRYADCRQCESASPRGSVATMLKVFPDSENYGLCDGYEERDLLKPLNVQAGQ